MYSWLANNDLAICDVLGVWRDKEEFLAQLKDGRLAAHAKADEWPVFLKACHLTQSSSSGTINIASPEAMAQRAESLSEWVEQKWAFRANDFERPWVVEGNMLTDAL